MEELIAILIFDLLCSIGCFINILKKHSTPTILLIVGWGFFPTIVTGEYITEWLDYKIGDIIDIANYIFLLLLIVFIFIPMIIVIIKDKTNKNSK